MDFNKIKAGIGFPLLIGIVLLLAEDVLFITLAVLPDVPGYLNSPQLAQYLNTDALFSINAILAMVLPFVLFFLLFLWTGKRAAVKYKADVVEAGVTAAIVAVLLIFFEFAIDLVLVLIGLGFHLEILMYTIGNLKMAGGGEILLAAMVNPSNATSPFCICFGKMLASAAINFVVGGIGGYLGVKK